MSEAETNPGPNDLDIDFITDYELRGSLESDLLDIERSFAAHAWKPVLVLSGSVIEAVLLDSLLSTRPPSERSSLLRHQLAKLAELARADDMISEKSAGLTRVVRHYRNLIHPGRAKRLGEAADEASAAIARALVRLIVGEIAETRKKTHGYTAEQLASKIEQDRAAPVIFRHLIQEVRPDELKKLLVTVLPDRYLFHTADPWGLEDDVGRRLAECYRISLSIASDDLKRQIALRYISILKEGSEEEILSFDCGLFVGEDLAYVAEEMHPLVIDHLLDQSNRVQNLSTIRPLVGLAPFLSASQVPLLVDPLVKAATQPDGEAADLASRILDQAHIGTAGKAHEAIRRRVDDWIRRWEDRDDDERLAIANRIRGMMEVNDIPF